MRTRIAWALVLILLAGQFIWHGHTIEPVSQHCFHVRFTTVWGLFSILSEPHCNDQAVAQTSSEFPEFPPE